MELLSCRTYGIGLKVYFATMSICFQECVKYLMKTLIKQFKFSSRVL